MKQINFIIYQEPNLSALELQLFLAVLVSFSNAGLDQITFSVA